MMKKRRAPVQSVLAERKMFAGGGMLPISKPMEQKQPSGILASSEPLIDAVAQEVLAPMTGGPLTMAEGGSVMRQSISSNLPRASSRPRFPFPINFQPYGGGVLSELESLSDEMGEGLSDIGERIEGVGDYADKAADRLGQSFGRQLDSYANTVQGQLGTEGYRNPFSRFFGRQGLAGLLGGAQTQVANRLEPQVTPQPKPEPDQLSNGFLPTPQRMNQGGIAQLQAGGMPIPPRSARANMAGPVPLRGIQVQLVPTLTPGAGQGGPFEMTLGDLADETSAEKLSRLFPDAERPDDIDIRYPGLKRREEAQRQRMIQGKPRGRVQEGIETADIDMARSLIGATDKVKGFFEDAKDAAVAGYQAGFSGQMQALGLDAAQIAVVNDLIQSRPDLERQILESAGNLAAGKKSIPSPGSDPDDTRATSAASSNPTTFKQQIARDISNRFEADQDLVKQQMADAKIIEEYTNIGTPFEQTRDMQQPDAVERPADTGDAGPRTEAQDMMSGTGQVGPSIPGLSPDDEIDEDIGPKPALFTEPGRKPEAGAEEAGPQEAGDPFIGEEGAKDIMATFDKEDMSKEDATKTIDQYKKEFLDQMPEYQGMSEEEKGYALMEAGLRVAAGESPNAVANVAKGLQGLGATFAKDEKEKRVWDRQVNLSAAKYGIQSIQKDRQNQIALAAEGRKRPFELIATKDYVDQATGLTVKRGTAVPLTNQQITDGYLTKYPLTYRETFLSDAKALADLAKANKKDLLKPQNFTNDRKTYVENARSVKNGIRMKELLLEAANIAIPEGTKDNQILGAVPLFKSWVNKAFNAAGYQIDTAEGREKLSKLRSDNIDQYRTLMKTIGTTMVTEILNESNKTISEGDRQRVDDLVAAYSDFDGTFASYRALLTKLKNLERSIDSGIQNASNSMQGIEEQWGTAEFVGGGKAADVMQRIRQGVSAPGYSVGQTRSQAIPYRDIIDMQTRKFTPKYQSIFGKRP